MTAIRRGSARSIRSASCAGTREATSPAQPPFQGEADPMEARRPVPPGSPGRRASSRQPPAHRLPPRRSPCPPLPPDAHTRRGGQGQGCALRRGAGTGREKRSSEGRAAAEECRAEGGGERKTKRNNHTRRRYANLQSPNSKSLRLGCNAEDEPM